MKAGIIKGKAWEMTGKDGRDRGRMGETEEGWERQGEGWERDENAEGVKSIGRVGKGKGKVEKDWKGHKKGHGNDREDRE